VEWQCTERSGQQRDPPACHSTSVTPSSSSHQNHNGHTDSGCHPRHDSTISPQGSVDCVSIATIQQICSTHRGYRSSYFDRPYQTSLDALLSRKWRLFLSRAGKRPARRPWNPAARRFWRRLRQANSGSEKYRTHSGVYG